MTSFALPDLPPKIVDEVAHLELLPPCLEEPTGAIVDAVLAHWRDQIMKRVGERYRPEDTCR